MSKQTPNPFFDNDLSKLFDMSKYLDVSKFTDMSKMMDMSQLTDMSKFADVTKMMGEMKVPNVDVESMMAAQRKNLEAIASTNQKAFESMQSFLNRQADLARQSFEATTNLVQAVIAAPTPEEKIAKQVEATKSTIESCVGSLKELSELLSQNNIQAMQTVSTAVCDSMDNLQGMMKKP